MLVFSLGGSFAPAEAYQSFIEQLQAMKQDTIDEEDDPDIKEDPLYQMNLEVMKEFEILIKRRRLMNKKK